MGWSKYSRLFGSKRHEKWPCNVGKRWVQVEQSWRRGGETEAGVYTRIPDRTDTLELAEQESRV